MPYKPSARQYRSFAASNFKPVQRDVFQLPRIPGGDTFMGRCDCYLVDAEYHEPSDYDDDFSDLDEPVE